MRTILVKVPWETIRIYPRGCHVSVVCGTLVAWLPSPAPTCQVKPSAMSHTPTIV